MTTVLGTQLGTRLGTYLGDSEDEKADELAALEDYLAKNLFSWMRADYRAESGGKVTAFGDKVTLVGNVAPNARSVDPNHMFAQAGGPQQVAAVAPDAAWNNREVALFLGGQYYKSTIINDWSVLHSGAGLGGESFVAYAPTTNAAQYVFSNANGAGAQWSQTKQPGNLAGASALTSTASTVFNSNAGSIPIGVPTYVDDWLLGTTGAAVWSHSVKAALVGSGTVSAAPSSTAPVQAMTLGAAGNNGLPAQMQWAETLVAGRVDAVLRAAVRRYLALRYPVLA